MRENRRRVSPARRPPTEDRLGRHQTFTAVVKDQREEREREKKRNLRDQHNHFLTEYQRHFDRTPSEFALGLVPQRSGRKRNDFL